MGLFAKMKHPRAGAVFIVFMTLLSSVQAIVSTFTSDNVGLPFLVVTLVIYGFAYKLIWDFVESSKLFMESYLPVQPGRKGFCSGCGVCCRIINDCIFLSKDNRCRIYYIRPPTCRKFPRCEYDLLTLVETCDYYWDSKKRLPSFFEGKQLEERKKRWMKENPGKSPD
ncbi:Uncharacterised protein [uncultured archaeon]|nr:Uncharacterised protein [uncultured archaeon]